MPLIKSGSKKAISTNIREMMHAGHPQRVAVAAAMSTARKYGRKRAEGGKALKKVPELPPISDGIGQLLKDQETAKLYDQIRNYIFPPEALLAQRGIFPGTSADTMETDASDLAIQRRKLQEGANPWWTAKSFATGGDAMSYADTARKYSRSRLQDAGIDMPIYPPMGLSTTDKDYERFEADKKLGRQTG